MHKVTKSFIIITVALLFVIILVNLKNEVNGDDKQRKLIGESQLVKTSVTVIGKATSTVEFGFWNRYSVCVQGEECADAIYVRKHLFGGCSDVLFADRTEKVICGTYTVEKHHDPKR